MNMYTVREEYNTRVYTCVHVYVPSTRVLHSYTVHVYVLVPRIVPGVFPWISIHADSSIEIHVYRYTCTAIWPATTHDCIQYGHMYVAKACYCNINTYSVLKYVLEYPGTLSRYLVACYSSSTSSSRYGIIPVLLQ